MSPKPPPGMLAAAEQDYHRMRDQVAPVVLGARLLLAGASCEVEVFADVYYTLRCTDPRIGAAMGAAAIMQLAKQTRTFHQRPTSR